MPKLAQSLSKYDLGFLRVIAKLWGYEYPLKDKKSAIEQLSSWLTESQNIQRILRNLPYDAQAALEDLIENQGRLPSAVFRRKYGEIRQVGAGKRDREAIFLSPQNASEYLYFQALVFQDFFESEQELEEYFYIPNDLLTAIPISPTVKTIRFETELAADQIEPIYTAKDFIVDDLCTCLAWLRIYKYDPTRLAELRKHLILSMEHIKGLPFTLDPGFLVALLTEAAILDSKGSPIPETTRNILTLPRWEVIQILYETWLRSTAINELKQLEQLECLGEWQNDAIVARNFITNQLGFLKTEAWYDLNRFIEFVHDHFPDFQRPAGNYEIWLIRRRSDGKFLKGFDSWYSVEGELLRYLILGPLVWFGIVELGLKEASSYAFRITQQGVALLQHQTMSNEVVPEEKLQVHSTGTIFVPRHFSPSNRYQIARFCEWEGYQNEQFHYRITPTSLQKAQKNHLKPLQLLRLLHKHSESLPPTLVQAIRRWITYSTEIQIKVIPILQVRSPDILEKIKKSPNAKYLQQILNPTTAIVVAGKEKKIAEQFLAMGYFVDVDIGNR
ncbi:MAG: helicase-associated domain-containing protein [Anaerolineales bacterium]|nr:helicase-associated domain-containing protein [Anaerolineales bacterium]